MKIPDAVGILESRALQRDGLLFSEREALKTVIAACRIDTRVRDEEDAQRYRWLRNRASVSLYVTSSKGHSGFPGYVGGKDLDREVDQWLDRDQADDQEPPLDVHPKA